jgi:hypothetical protein
MKHHSHDTQNSDRVSKQASPEEKSEVRLPGTTLLCECRKDNHGFVDRLAGSEIATLGSKQVFYSHGPF